MQSVDLQVLAARQVWSHICGTTWCHCAARLQNLVKGISATGARPSPEIEVILLPLHLSLVLCLVLILATRVDRFLCPPIGIYLVGHEPRLP